MSVVVITRPEPLVDIDTAKAHLRVDHNDDDTLIAAYIAAACAHIDGPGGWLNAAIGAQTLELRRDSFIDRRCDSIDLPFSPVREVVSVKYLDADGVEQTADPTSYVLASDAVLHPAYGTSWPSPRYTADAVRIRYDAGYEQAPEAVVAAVLLMVGDLYQRRESTTDGSATAVPMSTSVENLLAPYRAWRL